MLCSFFKLWYGKITVWLFNFTLPGGNHIISSLIFIMRNSIITSQFFFSDISGGNIKLIWLCLKQYTELIYRLSILISVLRR